MKKSSKILLWVIVVLVITVAVLAWLNGRSVGQLDPATLVIKEQGQEVGSITLEEITQLGGEEFSVVLRSSGADPRENQYTGLPLLEVIEAVQPGLVTEDSVVSVLASDGFATSFGGEEMVEPEHIYLVWLMDGKPLGTKANGGTGPLLVIPRQHEFGQFWCKYAVEVDVR